MQIFGFAVFSLLVGIGSCAIFTETLHEWSAHFYKHDQNSRQKQRFSQITSWGDNNLYVVYTTAQMQPKVKHLYWEPGKGEASVVTDMFVVDEAFRTATSYHYQYSIGIDDVGYLHVTGDMNEYPFFDNRHQHLPEELQHQHCLFWKSTTQVNVTEFQFVGDDVKHCPVGVGYRDLNFVNDETGRLYAHFQCIGYIDPIFETRSPRGICMSRYDAQLDEWTMIGDLFRGDVTQSGEQARRRPGLLMPWRSEWTISENFHIPERQRDIVFDNEGRLYVTSLIVNCVQVMCDTLLIFMMSLDHGVSWVKPRNGGGTTPPNLPFWDGGLNDLWIWERRQKYHDLLRKDHVVLRMFESNDLISLALDGDVPYESTWIPSRGEYGVRKPDQIDPSILPYNMPKAPFHERMHSMYDSEGVAWVFFENYLINYRNTRYPWVYTGEFDMTTVDPKYFRRANELPLVMYDYRDTAGESRVRIGVYHFQRQDPGNPNPPTTAAPTRPPPAIPPTDSPEETEPTTTAPDTTTKPTETTKPTTTSTTTPAQTTTSTTVTTTSTTVTTTAPGTTTASGATTRTTKPSSTEEEGIDIPLVVGVALAAAGFVASSALGAYWWYSSTRAVVEPFQATQAWA